MKRIRVTFLHKDDQYLYVQSGEPMAKEPLKVRHAVVDVNAEFNDTVQLLWPQAQLNLLDVSIDETGALIPRFIVLEPDYLMDASSLAECYKNYGVRTMAPILPITSFPNLPHLRIQFRLSWVTLPTPSSMNGSTMMPPIIRKV